MHIKKGTAAVVSVFTLVVALMFAAPLVAAQAGQAAQAAQAAQSAAAPIQGDLVRVDANAKTLAVKTADGAEVEFSYSDKTEVTGAQGGAAGLASMKEGKVTVHFTEDAQSKAKTATKIEIQAQKQ